MRQHECSLAPGITHEWMSPQSNGSEKNSSARTHAIGENDWPLGANRWAAMLRIGLFGPLLIFPTSAMAKPTDGALDCRGPV